MPNGDRPRGRPFIPPPIVPAQPQPRRRRERIPPRLGPPADPPVIRGFFPGPVDVPVTTPVPFPIPPEAPPPVAGLPSLGSIILRGGIGGVIGAVSIEILRELGEQALEREIRELEAELESVKRRRRQREPFARDIVLPPLPQFETPDPEFETLPRPQLEPVPATSTPVEIETLPEIPIEIPQPTAPAPVAIPVPVEIPAPTLPEVAPAPAPATVPATRPATTPAPAPATRPKVSPRPAIAPFVFPFPSVLPRVPTRIPQRQATPRLTPAEPTALPSPRTLLPIASPIPGVSAPTQRAQRECQEVKRRRRRKGKCREGFFREFPGKTRYVTWRTVDCVTRRETTRSKAANKAREAAERLIEQFMRP